MDRLLMKNLKGIEKSVDGRMLKNEGVGDGLETRHIYPLKTPHLSSYSGYFRNPK